MMLLPWRVALSFGAPPPLTKIPHNCVAPSSEGGLCRRVRMAIAFGAERRHSAMAQCPAALQVHIQRRGLDFTGGVCSIDIKGAGGGAGGDSTPLRSGRGGAVASAAAAPRGGHGQTNPRTHTPCPTTDNA